MNCPNCQAALADDTFVCEHCHNQITLETNTPIPQLNVQTDWSFEKLATREQLFSFAGDCLTMVSIVCHSLFVWEIFPHTTLPS